MVFWQHDILGSKSQSNFDVRSFPSTNSSYTTLINYLIHLVETLLPLRDNIDRIEEKAIEQNNFLLDEKDKTSSLLFVIKMIREQDKGSD